MKAPGIAVSLLIALSVVASGCGPQVRKPRLFDPGNTATQRYEAILHDPYPLPDVGPEVVGGRPQGYQAPVPPVRRDTQFQALQTVVPPPG